MILRMFLFVIATIGYSSLCFCADDASSVTSDSVLPGECNIKSAFTYLDKAEQCNRQKGLNILKDLKKSLSRPDFDEVIAKAIEFLNHVHWGKNKQCPEILTALEPDVTPDKEQSKALYCQGIALLASPTAEKQRYGFETLLILEKNDFVFDPITVIEANVTAIFNRCLEKQGDHDHQKYFAFLVRQRLVTSDHQQRLVDTITDMIHRACGPEATQMFIQAVRAQDPSSSGGGGGGGGGGDA